MNVNTFWFEDKINDTTVRYTSDHALGGPREYTATVEHVAGGPKVVFDNDDAPLFLYERAERTLGLNA